MSDNNARIQLELVDGPAQKALADFVKSSGAADKALSGLNKSLGSVNKGVGETSKTATGLGKILAEDLGNSGSASVGRLAGLFSGPFLVALGSVIAAGATLKSVMDLTFLTERNDQIANSFEVIAQSAGLAGDSLKQGLLAATNGLADDDDVLRAANKSIIELGSNANRIPEIMEIARRSTALFGTDLIQNFENLSQALASGNTRALRNIGLVIDADSAQQKYAASLGVTVAQLSDAGKKQAITNAALEQAKIKFAGVDESSTKATQGFERLKVSAGNLFESFAKSISQSTLLATTFNTLSNAMQSLTPPSTMVEKYNREIEQTQVNVNNLTRTIEERTQAAKDADNAMFGNGDSIRKDIQSLEAQRAAYVKAIEIKKAFISATEEEARKRGSSTSTVARPSQINTEEIVKQQTEAAKKASEAELKVIQESQEREVQLLREKLVKKQITQAEFDVANSQLELERLAVIRAAEDARFIQENERLKAQRDANLITEADYYAKRDALAYQQTWKAIKYDADQLKSKNKLVEDEKKLDEKKFTAVKETFGNLAVLMQSSSRELFAIGKAASIAMATMNTYEAITKTMTSVPYPFNIPLAIAQGIAGFVQVSNIANTNPSFASGGIVPGTSYSGDNVTANVNSGEMILNRQQQSSLFSQISSGNRSSGSDRTNELLEKLISRDERIVVNIGGRTVVDTLRSEIDKGRRIA